MFSRFFFPLPVGFHLPPTKRPAVRPYFPGVDRAASLRPGEFLAVNRHSGVELAERVF